MLCISTQHAYFENRVPLAESRKRVVDYRDSPAGARIMSSRLVSQLYRYIEESCVGRPHVLGHLLAGQGWRYRWHPVTWPLLAAFATITAMFKCFNSMKIARACFRHVSGRAGVRPRGAANGAKRRYRAWKGTIAPDSTPANVARSGSICRCNAACDEAGADPMMPR